MRYAPRSFLTTQPKGHLVTEQGKKEMLEIVEKAAKNATSPRDKKLIWKAYEIIEKWKVVEWDSSDGSGTDSVRAAAHGGVPTFDVVNGSWARSARTGNAS